MDTGIVISIPPFSSSFVSTISHAPISLSSHFPSPFLHDFVLLYSSSSIFDLLVTICAHTELPEMWSKSGEEEEVYLPRILWMVTRPYNSNMTFEHTLFFYSYCMGPRCCSDSSLKKKNHYSRKNIKKLTQKFFSSVTGGTTKWSRCRKISLHRWKIFWRLK